MGPPRTKLKKRKIEQKGQSNGYSEKDETGKRWVDSSRKTSGNPPSKELNDFESICKVSKKTFYYIVSLVEQDLTAKPNHLSFSNGKPLSLNDQVAIALRRLSSGESLLTIGHAFGLNHSTVSQLTWRFVEAMEHRGLHHLQWPKTESEMSQIKAKFEKIGGLRNCCGSIDTSHITMCLPFADPSTKVWSDREKNHSMVLQAVVDPDLRFRDIVTGWPGKMSDQHILQSSNFFKLCEEGKRLNGKSMGTLGDGTNVGEYIVGDSGFPLLPWLITPYQGKHLSDSMVKFNKRHFATRMVAMRALARLKEMWKVIQGVMWRPDKHKLPRIILVCCLLHNIVIDMEDEVQDEMSLSYHHDVGYRTQICESVDKTATVVRDNLCSFLSGEQAS